MSIRKSGAALALCAAVSLSCTVKEDREMCPCVLSVDLSSCASSSNTINMAVHAGERTIAASFIPGEEPPVHDFEIPKGPCALYAVSGGEITREGTLLVPYGEQCGEFYVFASSFNAAGESARQDVVLHKEYAEIRLDLSDSRWKDSQYQLTLAGNACGVDLDGCIPVSGPFRFEVPYKQSEFRYARVPRQADASLALEVYAGNSLVAGFDLGGIIAQSGYDWKEQSLKDIYVKIPDNMYGVTVTISDWEISQLPSMEI